MTVVLYILPERISPTDWAEMYDDVLRLLRAHPARLLGHDWIDVAGLSLPAYTRDIERDRDDPKARRWCVAGERASLSVGAPQKMYRRVGGRYIEHPGAVLETDIVLAPGPETDILFDPGVGADAPSAAPEPGGRPLPAHPVPGHTAHVSREVARPPGSYLARVLDGGGPDACGLPLLAAAMVVEARFPRWAMAHGDFGRQEAEAARRWAEGVLGRPIALPVRVEGWRLVERLGARLEGVALVNAVARLLLGPADKLATLLWLGLRREDVDAWWLGKLREHADPQSAEVQRLLRAYFAAQRESVSGDTPPPVPADATASLAAPSPGLTEELEALATLPPGETPVLTPRQLEHVHALARAVRPRGDSLPWTRAEVLHTLATRLARTGPTLTEDAWDWISAEQDEVVLDFLAVLAALDDAGAERALVRRAIFENPSLCRYALRLLFPDPAP